MTYNLPFPISIAASTRIANLIGATLADAAKVTGRVSFVLSCFAGIFNAILLYSLRNRLPQLFTNDEDVANVVATVLPVTAAFQFFDATAAICSGILRGLGRQKIGGYVNLFAYYVIAIPISFSTAFALGWGLQGLWTGVAIGLFIITVIEAWYILTTSWEAAVEEATKRNAVA